MNGPSATRASSASAFGANRRRLLWAALAAAAVVCYALATAIDDGARRKRFGAALTELCTVAPDRYWETRARLLEFYPLGTDAVGFVQAAGTAMEKVIDRDDVDLTRLSNAPGQAPRDLTSVRPNARYYVFEKHCRTQAGVPVVWRLSVLLGGGSKLSALSLAPAVGPRFFEDRAHFPNLDFLATRPDTEAMMKTVIHPGMSRAEALAVMRRVGEAGRYGELSGPREVTSMSSLRYDYKMRRDVDVLARLAIEDVETVVILVLDPTDRVVDVRIP